MRSSGRTGAARSCASGCSHRPLPARSRTRSRRATSICTATVNGSRRWRCASPSCAGCRRTRARRSASARSSTTSARSGFPTRSCSSRARTPEEIVGELRAYRCTQWDPAIVDLALELIASGELELGSEGLRLLEQAPETVRAPGLAVLLVEDDDFHALLVTKALERALDGAVIARAGSVAGAAELANGSEWSLAVVDHNLPDGLGMEVLDTLRAHDPTLPIVMITGQGSEETEIEAFLYGASYY